MTLDSVEFIRRFLLHIVPTGFVRIRQFGFLANRVRAEKLELCRAMLGAQPTPTGMVDWDGKTEDDHRKPCPICKVGHMILISVVQSTRLPQPLSRQDSS